MIKVLIIIAVAEVVSVLINLFVAISSYVIDCKRYKKYLIENQIENQNIEDAMLNQKNLNSLIADYIEKILGHKPTEYLTNEQEKI